MFKKERENETNDVILCHSNHKTNFFVPASFVHERCVQSVLKVKS